MSRKYVLVVILSGWVFTGLALGSQSEGTREDRIEVLERRIQRMEEEKKAILEMLAELSEEGVEEDREEQEKWYDRFSLGGYGESHFNFKEGSGNDFSDLHRFVLYLGYDFSDWIRMHSETEIEHAFVADGDGEISIEQLYLDFLLSRYANVRIGRVLTPLGIINSRHEPTTFNGVERPSFARYIIPTTWSSDGIGIFGNLSSFLSYEMYLASGMDGSKFSPLDGIRGGRMKERPGLSDPALSGRIDFMPLINLAEYSGHDLRIGASFWRGGLDNGNKGRNPGIDASMSIVSLDAEYSYHDFDFRGAAALEKIDDAAALGNSVAEKIRGFYLETAWHFWPQGFRKGKLENSDAVLFFRHDHFDTQYQMPTGVDGDPAGSRSEMTFGLSFFPVDNLVLKVDYQIPDDETGVNPANKFNLGVGWYIY